MDGARKGRGAVAVLRWMRCLEPHMKRVTRREVEFAVASIAILDVR